MDLFFHERSDVVHGVRVDRGRCPDLDAERGDTAFHLGDDVRNLGAQSVQRDVA